MNTEDINEIDNDVTQSPEVAKAMGKIEKVMEKERRKIVYVTACHHCKSDVGPKGVRTLRAERDERTGKKVKTAEGKTIYYHMICKQYAVKALAHTISQNQKSTDIMIEEISSMSDEVI